MNQRAIEERKMVMKNDDKGDNRAEKMKIIERKQEGRKR